MSSNNGASFDENFLQNSDENPSGPGALTPFICLTLSYISAKETGCSDDVFASMSIVSMSIVLKKVSVFESVGVDFDGQSLE